MFFSFFFFSLQSAKKFEHSPWQPPRKFRQRLRTSRTYSAPQRALKGIHNRFHLCFCLLFFCSVSFLPFEKWTMHIFFFFVSYKNFNFSSGFLLLLVSFWPVCLPVFLSAGLRSRKKTAGSFGPFPRWKGIWPLNLITWLSHVGGAMQSFLLLPFAWPSPWFFFDFAQPHFEMFGFEIFDPVRCRDNQFSE